MPFVTAGNCRLYYRMEGNDDRPALIFSNSIGADHGMWDPQVADLLPHFKILRYDTRGHGASDSPPGDYTIERLGRDVLALADAAGLANFAFCGLSLGGATGQWLAVHAPDRVTQLILANTSPRMDSETFETRRVTVLEKGMGAIVDTSMQRLFSPETLSRANPYAASIRRTILNTNPVGYAGCCAAIRDMNQTALLSAIRTPTLVISGDRDIPTPWSGHGELLARGIAGARAIHLPASHLSNLERPRSFTAALLNFLLPAAGDSSQAGMAVRRAVLGDTYVDAAVTNTNDFTQEFQDLITRYAWETIWTRPGLDYRTRRLLVLAMTAAMGRWEEFRLHVRTGLEHELETCDLKEVLLQAAIYAGLPAANTGFRYAQEELRAAQASQD